jgi:hypothetical protein
MEFGAQFVYSRAVDCRQVWFMPFAVRHFQGMEQQNERHDASQLANAIRRQFAVVGPHWRNCGADCPSLGAGVRDDASGTVARRQYNDGDFPDGADDSAASRAATDGRK